MSAPPDRSAWKLIRNRFLSISPSEITLQARGFRPVSGEAQAQLETVGSYFLTGYHEALQEHSVPALCRRLEILPANYRGFAFEGAAMGCFLLDSLSVFRRSRWNDFLDCACSRHPYVLHVGAGWALARLPWTRRRPDLALKSFDLPLSWLVIDGYGFHEGFFHTARWIRNPVNRPSLAGYAPRAFDQGLGRSLWFTEGADVVRIAAAANAFDPARRGDLWSGIGLACAYAGQATVPELDYLIATSGTNLGDLRQGVAFGAEARIRGQISNEFTEQTCLAICGIDTATTAAMTHEAHREVDRFTESQELPRYERWRVHLRELLLQEMSTCP